MKKNPAPPLRGPRFNRFQTAIPGIRFVHTAVDAHFDPDTEPTRGPVLSREAMENVARVTVGK